ncbi:hypothetical protein LINPERHAP1_LOCUS32027, partial [Linum perenne]
CFVLPDTRSLQEEPCTGSQLRYKPVSSLHQLQGCFPILQLLNTLPFGLHCRDHPFFQG